jgi:hypothetical protein
MGIGLTRIGGGAAGIFMFAGQGNRVFVCAWDDRVEGRPKTVSRIAVPLFGHGSVVSTCPLNRDSASLRFRERENSITGVENTTSKVLGC